MSAKETNDPLWHPTAAQNPSMAELGLEQEEQGSSESHYRQWLSQNLSFLFRIRSALPYPFSKNPAPQTLTRVAKKS